MSIPEWQPVYIDFRGSNYFGIYADGSQERLSLEAAEDFVMKGSRYMLNKMNKLDAVLAENGGMYETVR